MSQQSNDPPLVPVGGETILVGHRFEVVGHTVDRNGKPAEVPGRCLGKEIKQSKRAGQSVAVAPALSMAHSPTAPSSPPLKPPRLRKARRTGRTRASYPRFQPKPKPIVVINEPWGVWQWLGLIAVLGLIAAIVWFFNQGSEARKWETIEGAARAVESR